MKKLLSLLCLLTYLSNINAESFSAGNESYTYSIVNTSEPSAGVKHTRMRFTSPSTFNVSITEVDLTNPDVSVEVFTGQDVMFKTESLTNLYTRKRNAGRNIIAAQNGHFWSMSSQTGTSAGVHATNTLLGGAMVNGKLITETNYTNDQWNGGPSRHGILGITADGKAYIDNYQTVVKAMCPAKWGTDENSNSLLITEVNKYCIASDFMALFTPEYPSTRAIKVLDNSAGQPGSEVTGTATVVYLKMDAGQTMANNTWVTAKVGQITTNSSTVTRGDYDFVLVAAPGVSKNVLASVAVGDQMKFKYYWQHVNDANNIPTFSNVMAGNAIVMKDGAITTRATDEAYNTSAYARSLYGVSADNKKLIMAVVDKGSNNLEGTSNGTTTKRMSYIMKQFGADDVLQCDGGGSAQMMVAGTMVSKSSDSSGTRSVASGIAVYSNSEITNGDVDTPEPDVYNEVTPASGTANPYAFELTSSQNYNLVRLNYVLNAPASEVAVVVTKDGEEVETILLSREYSTEGAHEVSIDIAEYALGTYNWAIAVTGANKSDVETFKTIGFNHPQGVDVDCNMESPYFGRIYVTEGRSSSSSVHYSYANGDRGLYVFTPRFIGIQNWVTGKYAYTGGVSFDQTVGSKSGADFRKVRVSEDGRVFVTRQNDSGNYLYEMPNFANVQQQNVAFTPVFVGGTLNTTTYAYENGSTFISAPNIGFDVKGSGEDLTLAMLSGQAALFSSTTISASRLDEYPIGVATSWAVAAQPVVALSGKYTVNYSGTNICYDNRGGIWYCQYRGTPTDAQPALVYVDANGVQKYFEGAGGLARGGGGIRFNHDFTKLAIPTSVSTFSIYEVTYKTDGSPVLDELTRITHGMGTNINDFAWDRADNIYAVSNNNECLKAFALPRENNTFATQAASKFAIIVDESTALDCVKVNSQSAVEYYNLQGVKVDIENAPSGVYVKKQGSRTSKVFVK
ncbi:MAG: phosphodiester glycosidase family protein [Bacteroidales bacterium]|nr:phosphodiester glycosidase family protein [Bacteroidales bacterium]